MVGIRADIFAYGKTVRSKDGWRWTFQRCLAELERPLESSGRDHERLVVELPGMG